MSMSTSTSSSSVAAPTTLAQAIKNEFVDFDVLNDRYRPMLRLVNELIGVVPNCDRALEIWPTGFRTYNLIVPNLLNLPKMLFGLGASRDLVGLAMYRSSRAASCAYCSAHTCSFALRRGASAETISGNYNTDESAVVQVAESLSTIPSTLSQDDVDRFLQLLPDRDRDWIIMGVAMMGFLNKFMDAMGIELEPEAIADVGELIGPDGWSPGQHLWYEANTPSSGHVLPPVDGPTTWLRVLRQAPAAVKLERQWTRNVPDSFAHANAFLLQHVGTRFDMIRHLPNRACVRAFTTLLRDNIDATNTTVGLVIKGLVGVVFANVAENQKLETICRNIVYHNDEAFDTSLLDQIASARRDRHIESLRDHFDSQSLAVMKLATAIAPSPAAVPQFLIDEVSQILTPEQIVETTVWVSILQMLHRIDTFYRLAENSPTPHPQ